jgi:transposase
MLQKGGKMNNKPLPLTPDQRIKELEVQLKEANKKARLFKVMLDVIKNEYGLKIPKKPSGRSSRQTKFKV